MKATLIGMVVAAVYAIVIATGIFTLSFVIAGAIKDTHAIELFNEIFPRFRGHARPAALPPLGYAAFIAYVAIASGIAVHTRRRFADKWRRRAPR